MLKTLLTAGAVTASVLAVAAPASAATTPATDSCGTLPAAVQGSPPVQAGQTGSVYLFHDAKGWKLRVTHAGSARQVVTGTITATRDISHLSRVRLEKGDRVGISRDGHTLTFRLANYGHLDGVNFTTACSHALKVNVRVNGKAASTQQVHLGAHRVHPTSVPFTIERH